MLQLQKIPSNHFSNSYNPSHFHMEVAFLYANRNSVFVYIGLAHMQAKEHLAENDPILGRLINEMPFPSYHNTHDVFEDLCSCILDMRIHYAGSNTAFRYKCLKKILNGQPITPAMVIDPPEDIWLQLKLSHQKDESLKIWARKSIEEGLDNLDWQHLSDGEVLKHLDGIKGVGDWTKQIILLFTLEWPDVFLENDYQLKKAVSELYGLEENKQFPKRLEQISESWRSYRSLAVRYLWRWRENKSNRRIR